MAFGDDAGVAVKGATRLKAAGFKRAAARRAAYWLLRVADPYRPFHLHLESPPTADARPRWGYQRPAHNLIDAALRVHDEAYAVTLRDIVAYREDLWRIPKDAPEGAVHWDNAWFLGMDTAALYAQIRQVRPRRYIEVGSGNSTLVARQAIADGGLETEIVSIDPHPRVEVDRICDRVVRRPLESLDVFESLGVGTDDLLFVDASHRVFENSDMVAFYLDVLPRLPPGMVAGIHDILWPADYLPEWSSYWFSDQYLLGAYLLAPARWIQPVLACAYAAGSPPLASILDPLWEYAELADVDRRGFSFWFRIGAESPGAQGGR